jgi:hypothetical protein
MRKSIYFLILLLAGCAGKSSPSIAPVNPLPLPPPDREFPVAIRLTSYQEMAPAKPIAAEAVYGVWLREDGNVRTWLRLESPRIHLVLVDRSQGIGRLMDGEYTLARDGRLFGVITSVENISRKEEAEGLFRGEDLSTIRHAPLAIPTPPKKETRSQPFIFYPQRAGEELVLDGDAMFLGRYRKTAETRPTFSRPVPPLGKWEYQNWELKVRTTLHLSDKIEVEMLDQVTGRRVRLIGDYGVTASNLLYGLFTSIEQKPGLGNASDQNTAQPIPSQLFCFRYAVAGANQLQIRDVNAVCFDDKARDLLQRDFHRAQENSPASQKFSRR